MAFVPATATIPKPPAKAITALITAVSRRCAPPRTTTTSVPTDHVDDGRHPATTLPSTTTTNRRPPRPRREGGRPGRRRGNAPAAPDPDGAQADAAGRRAAHDRAGARAPGATTASTRRCSRSATGRTPSSTPIPTASVAGVRLDLRRRADAAGHGRRHPVRRHHGRDRRDLRGRERRRAHRPRHRRPGRLPPPARGAEGTIALTPVDDPSALRGGADRRATAGSSAFIEKPPRDEAPTNLINAGTYVLEPSVLDAIPAGPRVSIERETFPALVEEGTLFALGSDAYWLDTGTPDAYLRAHLRPARRPPARTAGAGGRARPRARTGGVADRRRVEWRALRVARSLLGRGAIGRRGRRSSTTRWSGRCGHRGGRIGDRTRCSCPGRGWRRRRVGRRARSSVPGAIVGQRCVDPRRCR